MAILIDEKSRYLIQGITGKQGSKCCARMLEFGSLLVAGVTPGKGGQEVDGVPVFNSVQEAINFVGAIDCSVVMVPPRFVKSAVSEAVNSGIKLVNIISENVPVHDMAYCLSLAKSKGVMIVGATSAGVFSVGKSKCGPIASGKSSICYNNSSDANFSGNGTNVGIISRSGGMSSETSLVLSSAGIGQSTVVSIGSDILMGTSYLDLIELFEKDEETDGIVLFGEIGGPFEEDLSEYLINRKDRGEAFSKPIVAFVSGDFAEGFSDVSLGHAGAIIESGKGSKEFKVKALKEAGVIVAKVHHEVGQLMKKVLET